MPTATARPWLPALIATSLVLSACSNLATPRQVPTAQRPGQGWVVTRPLVAAELVRACPGGLEVEITDFWAPSRSDIDQLEARLPQLQSRLPEALTGDRQYVGIISRGQRQIYVRGFPATDNAGYDPTRAIVVACDIGWHALYDPQSGQFIQAVPAQP